MSRFREYIAQESNLTLSNIQKAAKRALPPEHRACPWLLTDRGTAIYDSDLMLDAYLASYTDWHKKKLRKAFEQLPAEDFRQSVNIIDWGCGQGIGTLYYIEYLRAKNLLVRVKEIVLVEPSVVALERAQYLLGLSAPNVSIRAINKKLDDVSAQDVLFDSYDNVIHIFSNILDVQGIDLRHLSQIFYANTHSYNILFCVCPFYPSAVRRTEAFLNYFRHPLSFDECLIQSDKTEEGFTYYIRTLKLIPDCPDQVVDYKFYPPVHFRSAYLLDAVADSVGFNEQHTYFEVSAAFDLGASARDDIHPVLAVLHNIISRGLPTKCSPYIERIFRDSYGYSLENNNDGSIYFGMRRCHSTEAIGVHIANIINESVLSSDLSANELYYTPIAIARLQKTLIEVLNSGRLSLEQDAWDILVEEKDVPFAKIAFEDFRMMFDTLASITAEYTHLRLPHINLTIVSNSTYASSPLHMGEQVFTEVTPEMRRREYDLVVHYSSLMREEEFEFSTFKARNDCYFAIYSTDNQAAARYVYTTDRITYLPFVRRTEQGTYKEITDTVASLTYFLNLIFRKQSFRPGQLPILNRALANQSVIGLLPTGGGKSLTYQLAAMLQPGVTIVIDPLVSLMKDQYDGLLALRIDCCTFINSTVDDKAVREQQMEQSRMLFVFMSPERLCIKKFRDRLKNMADMHVYFSYGVIDEVHCVSEWGHDFRFSYLHLGRNLYKYVLPKQNGGEKHITLFGLTATASFDVLADVERELSGNGAFPLDSEAIVRYENTNRLELQYQVVRIDDSDCWSKWDVYRVKSSSVPDVLENAREKLYELQLPQNVEYIKKRFLERENIVDPQVVNGINHADLCVEMDDNWFEEQPNQASAIVFCPHRKGSLGVYDTEKNNGAAFYLGIRYGESNVSTYIGGEELTGQERFICGESSIMTATKAFGMGIDKPNVRLTVNLCHSGSLEAFVQEAGRAGRDRKMALATILYSPKEFMEQNKRTRLMENIPVDYGVHKFFYDGSFIGAVFEKWVMHYLLTQNAMTMTNEEIVNNEHVTAESVTGFMGNLLNAEPGQTLVSYISYSVRDNEEGIAWINSKLLANNFPTFKLGIQPREQVDYSEDTVGYTEALQKAIYRMCCVGIIDDYTQDYQHDQFRIVTTRKTDNQYFQHLKSFLMRYYTEERAELEMRRAHSYAGNNALQKCLGYITEFVYSKIATKRKRAIQDIEDFCYDAVTRNESWLETNEHMKDYIYFYFNSKYAREGYQTENGIPYSLTDDTEQGKVSTFDILLKYVKVADDEVVGATGSPKDNIKHLQGAVRLIRRALTDSNPTLDLLNAYCLFYLKPGKNKNLQRELKGSYIEGYKEFKRRTPDYQQFYVNINKYKELMLQYNAISNNEICLMEQWDVEAEVEFHTEWINQFTDSFTEDGLDINEDEKEKNGGHHK